MKTTVVNLRHDNCDIRIDRHSEFGNPFRITTTCSREQAIQFYKEYFLARINNDENFRNQVLALKGLKLGCWCKPLPCHGDVIIEWLEEQKGDKK